MGEQIYTGLFIWISSEELEDDKLNGPVNVISLGIYEIFTDNTLLMSFYLDVK